MIGMLTEASGIPLQVGLFEGNRSETATMLPTIEAFMDAHRLVDVTIVGGRRGGVGGEQGG
jgi:transposase